MPTEAEKNTKSRSNQKLKIMYLAKILLEKTDDQHELTVQEIIDELALYNVTAERKSIYNDLESLRQFGLDIVGERYGRNYQYKIASRDFELAELKLLVDSVQSSKFITEKKSSELIHKLEGLVSKNDAKKLSREVYVAGRVKTMNEKIWYSVDVLHEAINTNRQISFQYLKWTVEKTMVPRHDGKVYEVSPFALSWDDENYYMIAYDSEDEKIKYFRVDKMQDVTLLEGKKREGETLFKNFNMADFARKTFGMFGGEERTIELVCHNDTVGIMLDRFGKEAHLLKKDEDHFSLFVNVQVSNQFIFWILSLGDKVKIVSPNEVVEMIQGEIERLKEQYM